MRSWFHVLVLCLFVAATTATISKVIGEGEMEDQIDLSLLQCQGFTLDPTAPETSQYMSYLNFNLFVSMLCSKTLMKNNVTINCETRACVSNIMVCDGFGVNENFHSDLWENLLEKGFGRK